MNKPIETRAQFQELAEVRLKEAKDLLDLERWDGAYYLAGYAVELGLKSCIIKTLMTTDLFPARDFSKNCYTHSIEMLVSLASLTKARDIANAADAVLEDNWTLVKDWSEVKRYVRIEKVVAEALYAAIADGEHGVFTWIKTQW